MNDPNGEVRPFFDLDMADEEMWDDDEEGFKPEVPQDLYSTGGFSQTGECVRVVTSGLSKQEQDVIKTAVSGLNLNLQQVAANGLRVALFNRSYDWLITEVYEQLDAAYIENIVVASDESLPIEPKDSELVAAIHDAYAAHVDRWELNTPLPVSKRPSKW